MFAMIFVIAALAQDASASPEAPASAPQVRQTVEKCLAFLEKDGLEWETTKCVSCHHGPWMMWSRYEANKRGFTVNDQSLEQVRAGDLKAYNTHPKLKPTSRDVLTDLSINVIYLTFGMGAAGEPDAETAKFFDKAATHLLEQQKEDGGWSQTPKLKSDALGTGQALMALTTAGLTVKDPAVVKACGYLIANQKEDGSWFVISRAYEPPQFAATWAPPGPRSAWCERCRRRKDAAVASENSRKD